MKEAKEYIEHLESTLAFIRAIAHDNAFSRNQALIKIDTMVCEVSDSDVRERYFKVLDVQIP